MRTIEKQIINYLRNNDFLDYPKLDNVKNLSMRDSVDISNNEKSVYLGVTAFLHLTKKTTLNFLSKAGKLPQRREELTPFSWRSLLVLLAFIKKIISWFFLLPLANFLLIRIKSTPLKMESPKK